MEQKATKTAYLPEFGRVFEVPADWDGTKINYFARQKMNNLSPNETIGTLPLAPKSKSIDFRPRISNDNVLKNINLKKEGEDTSSFTTIGKSAWNQFVDLTAGSGVGLTDFLVQNTAMGVLDIYGVDEKVKEKANKRLLEIQKKNKALVDSLKFDVNPYEGKMSQGIGSLLTSYGIMGANFLSKVLKGITTAEAVSEGFPLLAMFGLSSGSNMFYDVRQEGGSLKEASDKAMYAVALEVGLDALGLETVVRGLRSKYLASYIVAPVATGAVQEASQSGKDMIIKGKYDKRSEEEKLDELIDSSLVGGLGGLFGYVVARQSANKDINKVVDILKEGGVDEKTAKKVAYTQMLSKEEAVKVREDIRLQAVKAGYDEQTSQSIAEAATPSPTKLLEDVIEIMDREEPQEIPQEKMEELKQIYVEATSNANEDANKYILMKDELKSLIEKAGKDEQEADETARMMTSIAINSYQIAKEQGVDIDFDKIKNEVFKLNNIINYAQNEPISEAEQEDIWREVERERVAELQEGIDRYMKESQGGVLFSKTITNNKGDKRVYVNPQKSELSQILDNKSQRVLINKETGKYYSIDADNNIHFDIIETLAEANKDGLSQDDIKDHNSRIETYYNKYDAIYLTKNTEDMYEGHHLIYTSDWNFSHYKMPSYDTLEEARKIYDDYKSKSIGKFLGEFDELATVRGLIRRNEKLLQNEEESLSLYDDMTMPPSKLRRMEEYRNNIAKLQEQEQELRKEEGKLYSKAYVSTRFPLVGDFFDADRFEGVGENASAHGWGNYALKDKYTNKVRYYNKFNKYDITYKGKDIGSKGISKPIQKYSYLLEFYGGDIEVVNKDIASSLDRINLFIEDYTKKVEEYGKNLTDEERQEAENKAKKAKDYGSLQLSINTLFGEYKTQDLYTEAVWGLNERKKAKKLYEAMAKLNPNDFEMKGTGAQYEVDVPEDEFLLDEQGNFESQSEIVKQALEQIAKDFDIKVKGKKQVGVNFHDITGKYIYNKLTAKFDSKKQASKTLLEYGIKGIKYDGNIDGVGYVVFDGKDMPVKRRLLSQTEGDILGSYDMAKREAKLFKGHNPSTLTHELGHHFIISHLNFMERIGANDKNKPVFEFLSGLANREINSVRDMERADHENLIEAFIDYMNIGQAPNIVTGNIFQRAKNWLINEYNIHKTTASKEIREYFDSLISRESSIPEVGKIQDRIGEFKEILKQAQQGEQVFFNGLGKQEVKDLKKAINTRIRRKGMSLRDELIKSGGIKEGTGLAKALGFDVLKKDKIFSTKATAIESEQELIDWLTDKGYIVGVQEGESYSDTESRWNEVENLIYNAETVYKPEEQRINEEREAGLANQAKAQEIVDEILKDNNLGLKSIGDLDDLLSKITSRKDDVDIIKMNKSALQYLDVKLNELTKEYNNVIRKANQQARQIGEELVKVNEKLNNLKEETKVSKRVRELAQEQYIDFIKNQHLSGDNKVKMLSNVDEINSLNDLVRVVRRVVPQIQRLIEIEKKHIQKRNIDIILGKTKPKKRTKQFSTYTYNTLFEELRDINKLSKKGAKAEISKIMSEMEKRELEGKETFTWQDVIKNKMLHYKSLGMKASSQLMESLHNDLLELYMEANQKGLEAKIEKQEKRAEMIKEVVDYVDTHEASKNFISRLFNHKEKSDDLYIKNTNFYGISNALFGKKWADEHEMVTVLNQVQKDIYHRHDKMIKAAKKIYKTDSRDILKVIMGEKNDESQFILKSNDGAVDDISIMQIMDFYIGMKNSKTKKQLLRNYEVFDEEGNQITNQLEDLFGNLTQEDIEFADWLQKDLEKNYDKLNELYIKMYGIDMPQEENYFPRTSERVDKQLGFDNVSGINAFSPTDTISGIMKERATIVKPKATNVIKKYNQNIGDYYYMIDAFEKFKDIYDVITSSGVKNSINQKYSKDTYTALMNNIKAMSLSGQYFHYPDIEKKANRIINRIIASKIAINPDVFLKQAISFTNYMENMPVADFLKYQAEFWANPKKAIEFMEEFDKPFFESRKNAGLQTEAIARMTRELGMYGDGSKEKVELFGLSVPVGVVYNWGKWMGFAVKYGDITSIYLGGYARVKYLLDNGMSVEEARNVFEKETLQSQQDSSPASLASYQMHKQGFVKLLTAFLNAPAQYQRKMFDADIQWRRGEISDMQFFKTVVNFGVIQPALFVLLTNALRGLWSGSDEEESLLDGVVSQVLTSPFQGIPLLGGLSTNLTSNIEAKLKGQETNRYDVVGVLFIDDLNKAVHKLSKNEKDTLDWIDIATPMIEPFVIAPTNAIKKFIRLGKRISED